MHHLKIYIARGKPFTVFFSYWFSIKYYVLHIAQTFKLCMKLFIVQYFTYFPSKRKLHILFFFIFFFFCCVDKINGGLLIILLCFVTTFHVNSFEFYYRAANGMSCLNGTANHSIKFCGQVKEKKGKTVATGSNENVFQLKKL
jgi:hypothetical protein